MGVVMKYGLKLGLAVSALALTGCDHHHWGHRHADTAKIADDIKAKEAQWQKDFQSKDLEALVGQYSDDAAIAGPGDPLAATGTDRRKALQGLISDPNFSINFSSDRVLVAKSGDLASSRGHFSLTLTDKATNKPATMTGNYLTVYKRQDDDSWKAVEDFITPGPAAAAAAPAAK
jgi:ketosteroid isomerase-like protein